MKSYFRFLLRNKLYTAIEVVGMAVAIAFVVFIGSFVIGEYSADLEIKKQGNVYVAHSESQLFGCATLKEQLEGKFPEVKDMCRLMNNHILGGTKMTLQAGDYADRQKAALVDENFFRFFPFPLESGTPETVLKEKNSVVVSRTFANKVFGKGEDPIGKLIRIEIDKSTIDLNVTGVFSDFQHTIFYAPEIIYRIDLLEDIDSPLVKNGNGSTLTFMQLAEGADVRELEKRMSAVVNKEDFLYLYGICKEFILTPFSEINSCGVETTIPFEGVVKADFVSLFVAAGLFLLFFAVLNYISLTVAQTGFRAKEMASRRLLGTQRTGIIARYIAESFILTLFSFTLALLLVYLVSPNLSELIGKNVDPFRNMGRIGLLFMVLMLVLLSLLSGIIPALLVSGYKPIDVVRGNFARASKMTLGKILVGFQSGVAFITLVLAVVMFIQLKHMTDKPMGYERDNRICIQNASKLSDYHVEELKSLACVEKTGWVQFEPMTLGISGTSFRINGIDCKFDIYFGNQAAFDILGFKVLHKTGEPLGYSAWLPESTMRALGLDYDCTQIDFDNGSYIPVCGIIKDYQKGTSESSERNGFLNLAWIMEMEKEEDFRVLRSLVVKVAGDENQAVDEIKAFYRNKGFSEDEISVRTFNEMNFSLYDTENRNLKLLAIFTLLTLLLTILAMFAMSTYYARQHAREAALRKVMGSSRLQLFVETSAGFLKSVGISLVVALPVAWMAADKWLEGYNYRIDNPVYVYGAAVAVMLLVAILSISWQMIRLINTNPVNALKNE